VLLEVRELKTHFSLRGSFLDRVLGREAASVKAVDGVSLALRRGEVLGIVGESGSGKTTLGRTLVGLIAASSGSVLFEGRDITHLGERALRPLRRRLQIVFQDPHASLNPAMTIAASVGHPLKIHGIASDEDELRAGVAEALERVGLAPAEQFMDKYPGDLSGGQKQRAVLARAIILDPDVLIADEPVSMLDMSVRAKILELMSELKEQFDLTYLYITHDLATAKYFCDRVAIMYLGRIVEIGPAHDIYESPKHPYTAALLRAIPEPDPRRSRATCREARCPTPSTPRSAARSILAARARSRYAAGRAGTFERCWRNAGRGCRRSSSRPSAPSSASWARSMRAPRTTSGSTLHRVMAAMRSSRSSSASGRTDPTTPSGAGSPKFVPSRRRW
jgi:oligopeptide/dipeptide ABC transporter ATP-binding protein